MNGVDEKDKLRTGFVSERMRTQPPFAELPIIRAGITYSQTRPSGNGRIGYMHNGNPCLNGTVLEKSVGETYAVGIRWKPPCT